MLQVAEQEAHVLVTACTQPLNPQSHLTSNKSSADPGATSFTSVSTPASRLLASVKLQLAQVELELSRLSLQYAAVDKAARRPEFPEVQGRDPSAVIEYLERTEGEGGKVRRARAASE